MLRQVYSSGRQRAIIAFHASMASAMAMHDLLTGEFRVTSAA